MPTKNRNNKNSTRSSTASTKSTVSVQLDDDFASILVKLKPVTSKKTTPKMVTPRPEFLEPLSPTPNSPPPPSVGPSHPTNPWETVGMTQAEFTAMQDRVRKQMIEDMRQSYITNIIADLKTPSFWNRRIESLEKEREYFNKKRGWSAADIACVEQIDDDIKECQEEIEALYAEQDRLEYVYD